MRRACFLISVLLVWICIASASSMEKFEQAKKEVYNKLRNAALEISFNIPRGSNILILPLVASDVGQRKELEIDYWFVSTFGSILKDVPDANYKVILRNKLEEAMKELRFSSSDLVNSTNRAKLGRFLGATVYISGKREILKNLKLINLSTVEVYKVETTELLTSIDITLPLNIYTETLLQEVSQKSSEADSPSISDMTQTIFNLNRHDFPIYLSVKKKIYKIGEKIVFKFRSSRDCYIYLLNYNTTSGKLKFLFPNKYAINNFIRANQVVELPFVNSGYDFVATSPVGKEKVILIATNYPIPNLNWLIETALAEGEQVIFTTRSMRNIAIVKKDMELLALNQNPLYVPTTIDEFLVSTTHLELITTEE